MRGIPLWRGQGEDLSLKHKPCFLNLIAVKILFNCSNLEYNVMLRNGASATDETDSSFSEGQPL